MNQSFWIDLDSVPVVEAAYRGFRPGRRVVVPLIGEETQLDRFFSTTIKAYSKPLLDEFLKPSWIYEWLANENWCRDELASWEARR